MLTGDSDVLNTNRMGVDLLVTVDVPLKWGKVALIPGIGIGAGWMRVSRELYVPYDSAEEEEGDGDEDDEEEEEEEQDGENEGENHDDDDDDSNYYLKNIYIDNFGMRLNAHLLMGIDMKWGMILVFGISLDVLLLAHTDRFIEQGGEIAGEPRGFVRGVVGLRFGMP